MKKYVIIMSVLALCGGTAFSQSELDAYKYSQSELSGTARYLGMGGAFGALGGDISAMNSNPAGLGIYRSSEIVTTLSVSSVSANTNWLDTKVNDKRTRMSFDNIGYVGYFPTGNDEGVVSWNVGFSYNRLKNYSRNYTMSAGGALNNSLSDYVASIAYGNPRGILEETKDYNPYANDQAGGWMPILGYNAGFIDAYSGNDKDYYSAFGEKDENDKWVPYKLDGAQLKISERGSIDQYDIAFGVNISDFVMLGATVAITDLNYRMDSRYDERFVNDDYLYLDNYLKTDGTGYAFNVGAIVRPADFLRLGVAYNSPTWYKMTDRYYGEAGSSLTFIENGQRKERNIDTSTPNDAVYDYEFRSPDKWIFSAAAIIGTTALLSVDYELTNFKSMRKYNRYGDEDNGSAMTNQFITEDFKAGNTIRVGAEIKVTPQFSVRAGVAHSDSPIKAQLKEGNVEVITAGTIPNYIIDKGVMNYTVGLGYRFTPNFYTDIACVFRSQKEDVYAFSSLFDEEGPFLSSQPATMKTNTTRVALTLGYKF